jgi:hypothetical protein
MWCWDLYWSNDPFVWWSDAKILCEKLTQTELELADMTADYHRWHAAYLELKYPDSSLKAGATSERSGGEIHRMSLEERAAMDRALAKSMTVIDPGYLEETPCVLGSCNRRNMQGGCDVKDCKEPACY